MRLDAGKANSTINRELAALKRMFHLGRRADKVDRIPYIPMLEEDNVREGFFEHHEFIAVRSALPDYLKGMVTFAYKTGWRFSEITGLTWGNVDRVNGIVRIEGAETKNKRPRTVYLDDELKRMIERQWKNRPQSKALLPYVFPNRDGKGRIKDIRWAWSKACEDAELGYEVIDADGKRTWKGPIFHDLRRTGSRDMIRAGIPERVVMQITGHKTRSIFDRYNIVSDDDLKEAAERRAQHDIEAIEPAVSHMCPTGQKQGKTRQIGRSRKCKGVNGAGGGDRTRMRRTSRDFKSLELNLPLNTFLDYPLFLSTL
ncbi:MAG: tyrosine-type recombinase/integrase [Planctomycetota bacterium]|jgi:integrase